VDDAEALGASADCRIVRFMFQDRLSLGVIYTSPAAGIRVWALFVVSLMCE
jgi:hypothetical protein